MNCPQRGPWSPKGRRSTSRVGVRHGGKPVHSSQMSNVCSYSGTRTSAFGIILRNVSPNAKACASSPCTTEIFLMSPVMAST